jgi:hypothetical protein
VCSRLLTNREDAVEACQDTLLAAARSLPRFECRSTFQTWMFRIATNRARSACRRNRRTPAPAATTDSPTSRTLRRTSVVATTRADLLEALKQVRPAAAAGRRRPAARARFRGHGRNALALLRLLPMSDRDKDAEILVLRHQVTVLERAPCPASTNDTTTNAGLTAASRTPDLSARCPTRSPNLPR